MNKILNIVVAGVLTIGLNGCLDSNSEISCSGETETVLVGEIILPTVKDKLMVQIINETDPENEMAGLLYGMKKNMAITLGQEPDFSKIKNYESSLATVEKEFSKYVFNLTDIRTTSKDKELNKVECVGTANIQLENYSVDYAITYNAQLGDDKENVYVEVSELN